MRNNGTYLYFLSEFIINKFLPLQSSYHWIISASEEEVYRHTAGKQDRTYMLSMRSHRENHRVNCLFLMCILLRSAVPYLWHVDPLGPVGFSLGLYEFTWFHMSWSFSQCLIYSVIFVINKMWVHLYWLLAS